VGQDSAKDRRELCKAAAKELDPKRLTALVAESESSWVVCSLVS
jgi:hypothetical protein